MFPVIPAFELSCFLIAVFCLQNTRQIAWTLTKWFLLYTLLTEVTASVMAMIFHQHNLWLYNIYTAVNFFILWQVVYKLLPPHRFNFYLHAGGNLIFSVSIIAETLVKGILVSNVISDTISSVLILILCNWYFYLLLQKDEWIEIQNHAEFWFLTGLLLFSFCTIATNLFDQPLMNLYVVDKLPLRYILYIIFNLILYGCWSYSFVCKYRETISY